MLFETTRQTNFVVSCIAGFCCFTALLGLLGVFMTAPSERALHHFEQARFFQGSYYQAELSPNELLMLAETELVASLVYNPYHGEAWNLLARVTQEGNKMVVAHKALRFSHQLSFRNDLSISIEPIELAYNNSATRDD